MQAGNVAGSLEHTLCVEEKQEPMTTIMKSFYGVVFNILNVPAHSVVVLDNAKYHNAVVERQPTTSTRKTDIQALLQKHHIQFGDSMIKSELLQL